MDKESLFELKEEIEEAKTNVAQLTGQKNTLMSQLKKDWDCKTLSDAKKKVKALEEEIAEIETQIAKGEEELEEKLNVE